MGAQENAIDRIHAAERGMLRAYLASKPGAGEIEVTGFEHDYKGFLVYYTEDGEPKSWHHDCDINSFVYEHVLAHITEAYKEFERINRFMRGNSGN